ncbi:MAG: hypothetical protein WC857_02550 [Candidatus Paceibacterota bacterium]|jgi:hypothetical protein
MFEKKISMAETVGKVVGFSFSYMLFSTIVFFIFFFRKSGLSLPHYEIAIVIPLSIICISLIFKKLIS